MKLASQAVGIQRHKLFPDCDCKAFMGFLRLFCLLAIVRREVYCESSSFASYTVTCYEASVLVKYALDNG